MNVLKQAVFLPKPTLTEENLPDQHGRVFIVTGGYAGCGLDLSKILYSRNGTVYIAGRNASKAETAIASIKASSPGSKGRVEFLQLDLADLPTIKPAAQDFRSKESRLDVLTLNAGVMVPGDGTKTAQGHELMLGTNCLGSFLVLQHFLPMLQSTAATAPAGSVRVTFAGSSAIDAFSPKPGGMLFSSSNDGKGESPVTSLSQQALYGQSKIGNLYLASEFGKRHAFSSSKIVANAWNPGNLKSELQRHVPSWQNMILNNILFDARFGAYTELWAGWSEEAGKEDRNGGYIWPWGRFGAVRADVQEALSDGKAAKFWDWCERETRQYM